MPSKKEILFGAISIVALIVASSYTPKAHTELSQRSPTITEISYDMDRMHEHIFKVGDTLINLPAQKAPEDQQVTIMLEQMLGGGVKPTDKPLIPEQITLVYQVHQKKHHQELVQGQIYPIGPMHARGGKERCNLVIFFLGADQHRLAHFKIYPESIE